MDIIIRRLEPSDYEAMQKVFAGPKVTWGTLQQPYPSVESWRKRLTEIPESQFWLAAMVGDEMAGQLEIQTTPNHPRRKHVGQLGMAVRDDFQGKGVGTALMQAAVDMADHWLDLLRLELGVFVDNEPAVRLYQRFGFVIEGTLTRYAFRAGTYADVYAMARFRQE
ncbi:GNAT family N-acetyltransferase [Candidatus Villigracilis affinis]|uniref:GNAT family N-acetyltransferase n=1 Tax=Candidatus Villigracilis affinis TaxID=3140682 RepID=UPI002A21F8DB|nr:GNAT family N-acetyltransferase [Anaerolineales bacterium]